MAQANKITDHERIRQWAGQRGGRPARVLIEQGKTASGRTSRFSKFVNR